MERPEVDYLRLSVTDRCNLNCLYCTPIQKDQFFTHDQVLRYEEMGKVVKALAGLGIKKVRITGGEPLIKKNIFDLVRIVKNVEGIIDLSMTTNGVLLAQMADDLKRSGLDRVNISLDSLRPQRVKQITGQDCFSQVWQGVEAALRVFPTVKLNMIVMSGINDDEIEAFARLILKSALIVRFIEFFPTNLRNQPQKIMSVHNKTVQEKIESEFGRLIPASGIPGNGPAVYYRLAQSRAALGFINSLTGHFCDACTRLRVDCAGRVSPCLFSGPVYDARERVRNKDFQGLSWDLEKVLFDKAQYSKKRLSASEIEMSSLGG